jgi:Arc/MetJ family transcription regulator
VRTDIVTDDALMKEALELTGARTEREAVELGPRSLVRIKRQERINRYEGKLPWDGDPGQMRAR